tara:strand:+ start:1605 stop:2264 length:660 start_codon:yes stop_codon:yes gene_type:complete
MLGLFKKKLNVADHLDIINCLIIEEAEQQWNYHAVENNFDKEAFRGSSFAFGVIEMFVTKILKIKADNKVLMAIVQLGRDRCQEYITEHKDLKKQYEKLKDKDLLYQLFISAKYLEIMEEKYRDLKGMNEKIMIQGFDSVDFKYKKNAYEIVCEANRMLQLAVKTSKERFKSSEKSNQAYDKYQTVFNKLKETERKESIEKFSDIVTTRIEKRNPDNIL